MSEIANLDDLTREFSEKKMVREGERGGVGERGRGGRGKEGEGEVEKRGGDMYLNPKVSMFILPILLVIFLRRRG